MGDYFIYNATIFMKEAKQKPSEFIWTYTFVTENVFWSGDLTRALTTYVGEKKKVEEINTRKVGAQKESVRCFLWKTPPPDSDWRPFLRRLVPSGSSHRLSCICLFLFPCSSASSLNSTIHSVYIFPPIVLSGGKFLVTST